MTLSFMKEVLESRGILLTKSLGQNFLHDSNQLRRIMAAAELSPEDAVLEIGPGLGPLTENLVGQAGTVLAIEKDERLLAWLQSRFASEPRLTLVRADALDYLQAHPGDWSRWKLVSNLPFSVASTLLSELAQSPQPPERLIVTIQLEVATGLWRRRVRRIMGC